MQLDLFDKLPQVNNDEVQSILNEKSNVSSILDFVTFYHKIDANSETFSSLFDSETFEKEFNALKNIGNMTIMIDFQYIQLLRDELNKIHQKNENLNFLVKVVVFSKIPFVSLVYIQKFEGKTATNFDNIKIHLHEIYDDLTITKPIELLLKNLSKATEYMYEMFQYQEYLKTVKNYYLITFLVKQRKNCLNPSQRNILVRQRRLLINSS